jgi:c(7)-type cytochrome triheme protein
MSVQIKKTMRMRSWVLSFLLLLFIVPAMGAAPGDLLYEREDKSEIIAFPPSVFPHWIHRINYRCDACHDSLFEMKRGATPVTMELIGKGEVCGACHDGVLAFDDSFQNCARCHRVPSD